MKRPEWYAIAMFACGSTIVQVLQTFERCRLWSLPVSVVALAIACANSILRVGRVCLSDYLLRWMMRTVVHAPYDVTLITISITSSNIPNNSNLVIHTNNETKPDGLQRSISYFFPFSLFMVFRPPSILYIIATASETLDCRYISTRGHTLRSAADNQHINTGWLDVAEHKCSLIALRVVHGEGFCERPLFNLKNS